MNLLLDWHPFERIQEELGPEDRMHRPMDMVFEPVRHLRYFFRNCDQVYPLLQENRGLRILSGFGIGSAQRTGGWIVDGNPGLFIGYNHQYQSDPETGLLDRLFQKTEAEILQDESEDTTLVEILNAHMTEEARDKFGPLEQVLWSTTRTYIIGLNFRNHHMRKERGEKIYRSFSDDMTGLIINPVRLSRRFQD